MTKKLEAYGLKKSEFDPCIIVGKKVLYISYVYDIIFWARNGDNIHDLAMEL